MSIPAVDDAGTAAAVTATVPSAAVSPRDVVIPRRRPSLWIGSALLLVAAIAIVGSLVTNPNFRWDVVAEYLFNPQILQAVGWTLILTVSAMALAIVIAVTLALMRSSNNPAAHVASWSWIWFFRGTPVYTQLIFWGLIGVLYPKIALGVPFGPDLFSIDTSTVFTAGTAAIIGLGFNESAYLAEIFRAGLGSVDRGQFEAAEALGMTRAKLMRRIVLPQAMRVIIPPTGNETISMLKTTSLVLAVPFAFELTFATNAVANRLYLPIPLLIVSAIWYLTITSILMIGQHYLEQHFGKGGADRPAIRLRLNRKG